MSRPQAAVAVFDGPTVFGTVRMEPHGKHVKVRIHLQGARVSPSLVGVHAIHVHEYGDTTDGCASLGGHLNPGGEHTHGEGARHGDMAHAGDMVNNILFHSPNGVADVTYIDTRLSLDPSSPNAVYGRSVVVHRLPDDLGSGGQLTADGWVAYADMTDRELRGLCQERSYTGLKTRAERVAKLETESRKTGNAGGRIGCAVIGVLKWPQ